MFIIVTINTPPKAKAAIISNITTYLLELFEFKLPSDWFSDLDTAQKLKITVPFAADDINYNWLTFTDGTYKTLSGTPLVDGALKITFTATDDYDLTVSSDLILNVIINRQPILLNATALRYTVSEGSMFSFKVPISFQDLDEYQTLSLKIVKGNAEKPTWA